MTLVAYSDSEGSDNDAPAAPPKATVGTNAKSTTAKPAPFQKTEARKIKVDLPTVRPEPGQPSEGDAEGPPAKRARTGGAFGGFNALLPAPKRIVEKKAGLGKGVSLRTSGEAAFSRAPPPQLNASAEDEQYAQAQGVEGYDEFGSRIDNPPGGGGESQSSENPVAPPEVKVVGKATRFRPLSVANNKKKKAKKASAKPADLATSQVIDNRSKQPADQQQQNANPQEEPKAKVKRSLFSVPHDEPVDETRAADDYESLHASNSITQPSQEQESVAPQPTAVPHDMPANSLEAVAADLNLTPAQRRQLLGRNAGRSDVNIAHFNMDNEYRANEQIRQSGESVEHRAVKSIAPGKHSLQQLVNNARSNQDSIEDKWAEGKRNRSEGGSKYGF